MTTRHLPNPNIYDFKIIVKKTTLVVEVPVHETDK
jgi:hypothetical protein